MYANQGANNADGRRGDHPVSASSRRRVKRSAATAACAALGGGLALVVAMFAPWFVYMDLLRRRLRPWLRPRRKPPPLCRQPLRESTGLLVLFRILAAGLLPWTGLPSAGCSTTCGRPSGASGSTPSNDALGLDRGVVGFFRFRPSSSITTCSRRRRRSACCAHAPGSTPLGRDSRRASRALGPDRIGRSVGRAIGARLRLLPDRAPRAAARGDCGADRADAGRRDVDALANVRGACRRARPGSCLRALIVTYGGLVAFVMPALEQRKVVDEMAEVTARAQRRRAHRQLPAESVESGVPLLRRPPRDVSRRTGRGRRLLQCAAPFYCLMRRDAFDEFVAQGAPLRIVLRARGHVGHVRPRAVARATAAGPRRTSSPRTRGKIAGWHEPDSSLFMRPRLSASAPARRRSAAAAAGPSRTTPVHSARCAGAVLGPPRGGRSIAAAGSVGAATRGPHGRDRRRPVEDDRRRHSWRPVTDGQIHSSSVGAVANCAIEPRRRLHRHRRCRHPRQHHPGRRRL